MRHFQLHFGIAAALLCTIHISTAFAQSPADRALDSALDSALGFWVNRSGWVIEAMSCDDGLCGSVVSMGGFTENAQRTDEHNPDPDLRQRSLCGVKIFGAFEPNGSPGEWDSGWIYNPRDGKTYSSNMKLGEMDTLELRGFVLSPIFGRTIVLVRVQEPAERCDASETSQQQEAAIE